MPSPHSTFPFSANLIPFALHSQRLSSLLDTVMHESQTARDPGALADYLTLTGLIGELLDEAVMYSVMAISELQGRSVQVERFLERVEAVEGIAGGWEARGEAMMRGRMRGRKRGRSESESDDEGESGRVMRRKMEVQVEEAMRMPMVLTDYSSVDEVMDVDQPQVQPQPQPASWWMEPFYD